MDEISLETPTVELQVALSFSIEVPRHVPAVRSKRELLGVTFNPLTDIWENLA